jgi:hypothetical protein
VYNPRKEHSCVEDWNEIRDEYITDETASYRGLAKKYGAGLKALSGRAKAEGWVALRKQFRDKAATKTIDKIAEKQADRVSTFFGMADKLTKKLEEALDKIEPTNTQALRRIAASMRDLAEMQGIKPDLDREEQQARIDNLRRHADRDADTATEVEVVFLAGEDSWNE